MDVQQQRWSHESPFRSTLDYHDLLYEGRTNHQSKDESPTTYKPSKKLLSSQSSPMNQKAPAAATILFRNLPSIRPENPSAAPRGVSRPNGVECVLNPIAGDTTNVGGRQHGSDRTGSPWTAPIAVTSQSATPPLPPTSMKIRPSGDITLPSITPALMSLYPHLLSRSTTPRSPSSHGPYLITTGPPTVDAQQSPAVLPRDQAFMLTGSGPLLPPEIMKAPSMLRTAHPPPRSSPRSSPRVHTQLGRTGNTASRNSSPHSAPSQLTSASKPQSHSLTPFTSTGPTSTMSQLAFNKEAFDAPASEILGQSQYQMIVFETEQVSIQVPSDIQAASKVVDQKRKRNATASHRFRQRRKEKEQETSDIISKLEAQVREMNEEKEYYQQERDILQDVVLRNRVPIPPRPLSPRRRRYASLDGPQAPDTETSAQNGGRNTRRRTGAYVPQELPSHTVAAHVPF